MTDRKSIIALKAHAAKVFGSKEEGKGWLTRENMFLAGKTPLQLVREEGKDGEERVSNLLAQMEYGVYP